MASTSLISGLSSGIDWQSMVTQLIAIDHKRVDLITTRKTTEESKLSEWQSLSSKLTTLQTATDSLRDAEDFGIFKSTLRTDSATLEGSDLLSVTAGSTATAGSYQLKINNLATAEKRSSASFADTSSALGADFAGDILISGTVVSIAATDTLANVQDKINNANSGDNPTGVTAGIICYGTDDYRLILTSDATGADGISLQNGGSSDVLSAFGLSNTSRTSKNHIAGGDRSDRFTSTNVSIKGLLGLTSDQIAGVGDIVMNGQSVGAVDLSTDTLASLQTKLTAAGLTASITSETENGQTYYRLMVAGAANTYTDKNNILETLGFIKGGVSDVLGVTGSVANTSGGTEVSAETLIKDIDGYTGFAETDYIRLEGTKTGSGGSVSDDTFVLSATTTVGDLLTKIESLFGDVTATITGDGKLQIMDNTSGASTLSVKIGVKNSGGSSDDTLKFDADGDLGSAVTLRERQLVAGTDASLIVDGVSITKSENIIDDVITGVTLDLLKADSGTTIALKIDRDLDAILSKINAFVTSYNTVSSYIKAQTSYDESTQSTGGILFGDGTLSSVKSDLTTVLIQSVWGVSQNFATMGLVGVNVDTSGQISVNTDKLRGYLTTNFNDVRNLFAANGTTSIGTLQYISHEQETQAGEYAVNITQAATQSTSSASNNNSLSGDETLTITSGDDEATINLTGAITMSQIVTAINSEMSAVYTQVLTGANELYSNTEHTTAISASTTWNSVYNSGGVSAGLLDEDVIAFTGTSRNGIEVSGSYTISDTTTDTVQGLLSAIEETFANQVTAAINDEGRIVLTDKTSGASDLSLSFNYDQAHNLDFGSVLTTNDDGREGRYALDITASLDSTNHLILTHDSYGSDYTFTIHQANNLLWTSGDQTVNNGRDVAGTINGEAASGDGQVLTGNEGGANVDGMVVRYTGTATGSIGTIKLTLGTAELFHRALFNMMDSIDGYVSFKQTSIQDHILSYTNLIVEMEERLDRKEENMLSRFAAMELALSKIQNQSSWLSSQLDAASNGWK